MLSDIIRKYRINNSYSQKEIADLLGVSTRSVMRWENGQTQPNSDELAKLANLIGVDEEDLLKESVVYVINPDSSDNQTVLEKISDGVSNIVSSQEAITDSLLLNRNEQIDAKDSIISELQIQNNQLINKLNEQLVLIESYQKEIDSYKVVQHHQRIRTSIVVLTSILVIGLAAYTWWYWMNFGFKGEIVEGPVIAGEQDFFMIEDEP